MADEYSYNELMEMQDRAIKRVRDMQERARRTVEESQAQVAALNTPVSSRAANENVMPPKAAPEIYTEHPAVMRKNPSFSLDGDKAAILPVLLLLWREGADKILLAALMYIMA